MDCIERNPYSVLTQSEVELRTPHGYTPFACLVTTLVVGMFPAVVSGIGVSVLSMMSASAFLQMAPLGVVFGLSLWFAVQFLVGEVSSRRRVVLIAGCLATFLICGMVYDRAIAGVAPSQTLQGLLARVLATATGATVLVFVLRYVGGRVSRTVSVAVWGVYVTLGTLAIWIVEQSHNYGGFGDATMVSFACASVFQTVLVALITWQLAWASATFPGEWAAADLDDRWEDDGFREKGRIQARLARGRTRRQRHERDA